MSLSRKQFDTLASAGWTVAEFGPWPALRAVLRSATGRMVARLGWSR